MGHEIALPSDSLDDINSLVLTPELIRDRFEALGADDPEVAHSRMDEFMVTVLEKIRDGHPNPAMLAGQALTVTQADFPRWYA